MLKEKIREDEGQEKKWGKRWQVGVGGGGHIECQKRRKSGSSRRKASAPIMTMKMAFTLPFFFFFFLHCSGIFLASFLLYSFMPTFYFIIIIVVVLVQSFSSFWLCLFVIPILISLSSSSLLLKVSICHVAFTFHLLHLSVLNLQKWIALVPICSPQDTVWTRCVLACVHLWACVCMCVYESNRPKWQTVLTSLWLT